MGKARDLARVIVDSGGLISANNLGNAVPADGSITNAKIASMAASKLTGQVPDANAPSGSVIQVVSTPKLDTFSTTSSSFVDVTGLSATITPISTSSRILVTGALCWGLSDSVPYVAMFMLVRNGNAINIADAAGIRGRATVGAQGIYSTDNTVFAPINFLDSPNTTSPVTYKISVAVEGGRTVWVNRGGEGDGDSGITGRFVSGITLMEIAA